MSFTELKGLMAPKKVNRFCLFNEFVIAETLYPVSDIALFIFFHFHSLFFIFCCYAVQKKNAPAIEKKSHPENDGILKILLFNVV